MYQLQRFQRQVKCLQVPRSWYIGTQVWCTCTTYEVLVISMSILRVRGFGLCGSALASCREARDTKLRKGTELDSQ